MTDDADDPLADVFGSDTRDAPNPVRRRHSVGWVPSPDDPRWRWTLYGEIVPAGGAS